VPILFVITQFWVPQKLLFFFYIKIKIKDRKKVEKQKKNAGRRATWLVRTG